MMMMHGEQSTQTTTLDDFPRPENDNGRGVHWSHSPTVWGKPDWGFWQEQIERLQLKWVKMIDTGDGSSIGLAKRLIDMGVMPVVRFYRLEPNPDPISTREIEAAREYINWGVVYFETNNEPDLALEWQDGYRPPNWLEIVVDNFIIEADIIRGLGGYLLFPAFGPGGRGNPFQLIVERGRRDILDGNCALAIHNYCLGRPLTYPNDPITMQGQPLTEQEWTERGGMWAWEMAYQTVNEHRRRLANPNASILEDSTCFRAFEYFDALVNEAVGHSIPIFTTEGGYNVGQRAGTTAGDDPRYPKPTPEWAGRLTEDMFRYIQETGPDYYFACMPWLIAVARIGNNAPPFENQGPWYTHHFDQQFGLSGELPIVPRLAALPSQPRAAGPTPAAWARFAPDARLNGREFDPRLKYLEPQPHLQTAEELGTRVPNQPYWKLTAVRWADETEGFGYAFIKAVDETGQPLEGASFAVARPGATDTTQTKGAADDFWGNYLLTAELGTYTISMAEGGLPTDQLLNVGRGKEENPSAFDNTSFFLTFQRTSEAALNNRVLSLPPSMGGHALAFAPTGSRVAVGGYRTIQLWDALTGQLERTLTGHNSWVWAVAFRADGQQLASACWDQTVRVWDVFSGAEVRQFAGHRSWVSSVAFSPDGETVASGGADKVVRLWDVPTGREIRGLYGHGFHVWAVAFRADGRMLASASGDRTVRLWDIFSGELIRQLTGHQKGVLSLAFSPNGRMLASGDTEGLIRLWAVESGQLISQLNSGTNAVYSLAFSPDGTTLAVGTIGEAIQLWDVAMGRLIRELSGHTDAVRDLAFSGDGRLLASVSADKSVRVWVV